jgi:hypothetical protein
MVTNTPVGVLRAVVIVPSRLHVAVVHRLLRQTSTCSRSGRRQWTCDWGLRPHDGQSGSNASGLVKLLPKNALVLTAQVLASRLLVTNPNARPNRFPFAENKRRLLVDSGGEHEWVRANIRSNVYSNLKYSEEF